MQYILIKKVAREHEDIGKRANKAALLPIVEPTLPLFPVVYNQLLVDL